jgi:predicted Rossmann fold flavoprotein
MLTESFSIKKEYAKKFDKENDFGHNLKNYVEGKEADLYIDLKPGMTEEEIDERLIREISENRKKNYSNLISSFVPGQMKDVFPIIAGIDPSKKADQISREERRITAETLKKMHFTVIGTRDFNEAIVTSGGINVKEVDPSTMQSKLADGLYICGEMLDTDAQTGGYNLQTAWSTGHLAGLCAAGADM